MDDVYLSFKGSGREGSMAAGHYLLDAAHTLGVDLECDCDAEEPKKTCAVRVLKGAAFLSKATDHEKERLSASERKGKQRLACQVKIERPGEIELALVHVKEEEVHEPEPTAESFKKEFSEMPLDQKIKELVELEAMALGDTLSYIMNSPYEAVGSVMSVLAGFGRKMEEEDRKAKVPEEHQEAEGEAGGESEGDKKDESDSGETTDNGSNSSNGTGSRDPGEE